MVRRSLAAKLFEKGKAGDAGKLVKEAPEIPSDEKSQLFAAELLVMADPKAAHEMLDRHLEENAASPKGHLLQGRLHLAEGERKKAESHFKVAEVLDPSISMEDELGSAAESAEAVVKQNLEAKVEEVVEEVNVVELTGAVSVSAEPETEAEEMAEGVSVVEEAAEEPTPVIPKALAPPGSEPVAPEEAVTIAAAAEALATDESAPEAIEGEEAGELEEGVEYAEVPEDHHYHEEEFGERAFIVGDGEMVHAHNRDPDAKEKISAITMAIVVHAVLLGLLALVVIGNVRPNPPMITASVGLPGDEESIQNQSVTRQQRSASAVTSAQPVVNVDAFSAVALPEVTEISDSLTMVSMSNGDTGFGMSMSGFGDVTNMGAIPASMRSRCSMSERMKRLRESGGDDRAEKAVRNALTWLAKNQEKEKGSFGVEYLSAMTGLSLLAFLGHCETPESPKFGEAVIGGATFLMETAKKKDGFMFETKSKAYSHAIATYALCELHTMTKESGRPVPRLESIVKKAVKHIIEGQTEGGGWAYGYAQNPAGDDMSVVGWQIQALKAGYNTGEKISGLDKCLDRAMDYLVNIQDSAGAFKYRPDNPTGKPSLTGAALLGMQIWDQKDSAEYKKGLGYLMDKYQNPTPGNNFYSPYYNTQVFFLHGGKEWEHYNSKFQAKLLDAQNPDGSWTKPGAGGHGGEDAQFMNTAWGCLMLEVYYRYLPTTDKVEGLKR